MDFTLGDFKVQAINNHYRRMQIYFYTVSQKNVPLCDCPYLPSNIDRFSKFFHWHILWTSSSSVIIKHTTTP